MRTIMLYDDEYKKLRYALKVCMDYFDNVDRQSALIHLIDNNESSELTSLLQEVKTAIDRDYHGHQNPK